MYLEPEQRNRSEAGSTAENHQHDMDTASQTYQKHQRDYTIHRNQCSNSTLKALQVTRDDRKQRVRQKELKRSSCCTQTRNRRTGTKSTGSATNHETHNININKAVYQTNHNIVRVHNTGLPRIILEVCYAVDNPEAQPVNTRPTLLLNYNKLNDAFIGGQHINSNVALSVNQSQSGPSSAPRLWSKIPPTH
jgi:hypothetical protein